MAYAGANKRGSEHHSNPALPIKTSVYFTILHNLPLCSHHDIEKITFTRNNFLETKFWCVPEVERTRGSSSTFRIHEYASSLFRTWQSYSNMPSHRSQSRDKGNYQLKNTIFIYLLLAKLHASYSSIQSHMIPLKSTFQLDWFHTHHLS